MASLAVSIAMHNANVFSTLIEADEYPDLAQRYNVRGVPRTVIDESDAIEGAVPAGVLLEKLAAVRAT